MKSEVGTWRPSPERLGDAHAQALERAAAIAGGTFEVSEPDANLLRELMAADVDHWRELVDSASSDTLVKWLRATVLAEARLTGCERGAKSPAILIARTLRDRNAYPNEITAWIRSVSDNRFLPYGSLLDRL